MFGFKQSKTAQTFKDAGNGDKAMMLAAALGGELPGMMDAMGKRAPKQPDMIQRQPIAQASVDPMRMAEQEIIGRLNGGASRRPGFGFGFGRR